MPMNKAQIRMLTQEFAKKAAAQGLTRLGDIPEGSTVTKWNMSTNEPERDIKGNPIRFTITRKDQARMPSYLILSFIQDGKEYKHQAGFQTSTYFKVTAG